MRQITFNTTNEAKLLNAVSVCAGYGIELIQSRNEVDEIQSNDPKKIALDKAEKIFILVNRPVVITDDSWALPGLNGFPGAYMHAMNEWLTPQNFLDLTRPLKDRRIIQTQHLVYKDKTTTKVFSRENVGKIIDESRGKSKFSHLTITVFPSDKELTVAEFFEADLDRSKRDSARIWHDFAKWYLSGTGHDK